MLIRKNFYLFSIKFLLFLSLGFALPYPRNAFASPSQINTLFTGSGHTPNDQTTLVQELQTLDLKTQVKTVDMLSLKPESGRHPTLEQWTELSQKIETAYFEGDWAKLPAHFQVVLNTYFLIPAGYRLRNQTVLDLTKALSYLVQAYRVMGNKTLFQSTLQVLCELLPFADLNPTLFPPDYISLFKTKADYLLKDKSFELTLESRPPGADVYINDLFLGKTPLTIVIPIVSSLEFSHQGTLMLQGYKPYIFQTNGHFGNKQTIQSELVAEEPDSTPKQNAIRYFDTTSLPIDYLWGNTNPAADHSATQMYERLFDPEFTSSPNPTWVLDFKQESDTVMFSFCIHFRDSSSWWCEPQYIIATALRSVVPYMVKAHRQAIQANEVHALNVLNPVLPSAFTKDSATKDVYKPIGIEGIHRTNSFPWWIVLGGAVLAGGAAALVVTLNQNTPVQDGNKVTAHFQLPNH
jgi:hypothetical protein